jgi:natural product biosynthesis luciferase-like monooxygenase protein
MDFSLFYFANDECSPGPEKYRLVLDGARFADAHGLSAVWVPERHFHRFGGMYPNPALLAAVIATTTRRLQVRAGSVVLPLQNPIRVAEDWSVVDNLSGGRAAISFASGWAANDFVLAPHNYGNRRDIMYRDIETVRSLWRGESITLPNGDGHFIEVSIMPRPVQPELPVWVTSAGSPKTFERAGAIGANLLTHMLGQGWKPLGDNVRAYRCARQRAGHTGPGRVSLMVHTFLHPDAELVAREVRPRLSSYIRSSVDLLGLNISAQSTPDMISAVVEVAVEKYFSLFGLFGSPEQCISRVRQMAACGVDEIACLIDFGIATDTVLQSLPSLVALADVCQRHH